MLVEVKEYFAWVKKIRIEEWCSVVIFTIFTMLSVVFRDGTVSFTDGLMTFIKYFTFDNPYYKVFVFGVYLLFLWRFWRYIILRISNLFAERKIEVHNTRLFFLSLLEPIRLLITFALSLAPIVIFLTQISYVLRFSSADILFWNMDAGLFTVPPFVSLSASINSKFLSQIIYYAYVSLSFTVGLTLVILFIFHKKDLFRKAVLAFMISLVAAFPFFYFMPCQDPYHSFVQNLRGSIIPPNIQNVMADYRPNAFVADISTRIGVFETDTTRDNAVPVSCFPSTHAMWSFLVVYYLAILWLPSLFFTLPWIASLLIGGLLFAQHYFVDYIVAVPIASVGLITANYLLSKFGHLGNTDFR